MAKAPLTLDQIKHSIDAMLAAGVPPQTLTSNCRTSLVGGHLTEFLVQAPNGMSFRTNALTVGKRQEHRHSASCHGPAGEMQCEEVTP